MKIFVFLLIGAGLFAQSGEELIQRLASESAREGEFEARVRIASYTGDSETPSIMDLRILAKQTAGQSNSLALVLAPVRDAGRIFLNNDDRYWVYFPDIKRSTVLSPLAALLGDASSGDLLAPPPFSLYDIKVAREEGHKVQLELNAKGREAPYGKITQFYDNSRLLRALLYARSGVLLKTVSYSNHFYDPFLDRESPGLLRIENNIQKGRYTLLQYSSVQLTEIDDTWFNPNNLDKVR